MPLFFFFLSLLCYSQSQHHTSVREQTREKNNEVSIIKNNEGWATFVMIEKGDLLTPCSPPSDRSTLSGRRGKKKGDFLWRGDWQYLLFFWTK